MNKIPFGKTIIYNDIAKEIANDMGIEKMSSQAVGGAVGWNPICIIIPCHRVIGSNGNLTDYVGGIDNKIKLLEVEGNDISKFNIPKNCLRKPCVYRADALAFPVPGYKLLALDTVNNWVTAMPTACLPNTFNIDVFYSIMNGVQSGYYSYSNECITIIKHRINLIQMNSLQCNGQLIDLNNSYNQLKSIIAEFDS